MAEVNGSGSSFRYGLTSSDIMREASERSGSVAEGEGAALVWSADHKTLAQERQAEKDAAGTAVIDTLAAAAVKAVVAGKQLLASPGQVIVEKMGPSVLEQAAHKILPEKLAGIVSKVAVPTGETAGGAAVLLVGGTAMAAAELIHAWNEGDEQKRLTDLEAIDVASTALLDLPAGFKVADMQKHAGIVPTKLEQYLLSSDFGKTHLPLMQAEADDGMRAALEAYGVTGKGGLGQVTSGDAPKLASNVAWNKGYESVKWAVDHREPERSALLFQIQQKLDERNPLAASRASIKG